MFREASLREDIGLPFLAKKKLIMDSELIRIIEDYGCYSTNDLETIEALGRYCNDNNIAYRVSQLPLPKGRGLQQGEIPR